MKRRINMFEKVKETIVATLGCSADEVTLEAKITDDLGADSLDAVELSMALEEEMEVSIPDDQLAQFVTVGDIVSYLEKLEG